MIITFSTTTVDVRDQKVTFWFNVRLRGYECTALDVGFDKDGNLICASGSFLSLDPKDQAEIIAATAPMVKRIGSQLS